MNELFSINNKVIIITGGSGGIGNELSNKMSEQGAIIYSIDKQLSKNKKQKCGNGKYADIGVFSFHPVKHIACGEGGMLTTNSKAIYKKLLSLRTHGITKQDMSKNDGGWYYEMKELGYNYRLTDIQSALGITQLQKNNKSVNIPEIIK